MKQCVTVNCIQRYKCIANENKCNAPSKCSNTDTKCSWKCENPGLCFEYAMYVALLLIYGPPGTGKTTSVINLIKEYQLKNNQTSKELTQHLNASDERGINIS